MVILWSSGVGSCVSRGFQNVHTAVLCHAHVTVFVENSTVLHNYIVSSLLEMDLLLTY